MSLRIVDAVRNGEKIVRDRLAVRPGEEVLIVADTQTQHEVINSLASAVRAVGAEFVIVIQAAREAWETDKLNKGIQKAVEGVDVVIDVTRASGVFTYWPMKHVIRRQGKIRTLGMCMRSLDQAILSVGAYANQEEVARTCHSLIEILAGHKVIHITSKIGTDLTSNLPPHRKYLFYEGGFARNPGENCGFVDGEVFWAPANTANGTLVVDGPIAYIRKHITAYSEPITLEIKESRIVEVKGKSPEAHQLRKHISTIKNADTIGEIAFGLNPMVTRTGYFEEEKVGLGNMHIAYGRSVTYDYPEEYGWVYSPIHADMVIYDLTVELDAEKIMEDGKFLVKL